MSLNRPEKAGHENASVRKRGRRRRSSQKPFCNGRTGRRSARQSRKENLSEGYRGSASDVA